MILCLKWLINILYLTGILWAVFNTCALCVNTNQYPGSRACHMTTG